jgi:deoxycitidine kinase/deoxyguanosine kinase
MVSIEGNIGAGKSTFLEHMRTHLTVWNTCTPELDRPLDIVFVQEPVDVWQSVTDKNGEDILTKYYADPHKYAFAFQMLAYSTRLSILKKTIRENPNCDIIVCERSLEADRNIFAKMLRDDNSIEDVMYQIYDRLYLDTSEECHVDAILYLCVDPLVCYERIQMRNRKGESEISVDYLMHSHRYHEDWLTNGTDLSAHTCVRVLNEEDANSLSAVGQWMASLLTEGNDLEGNASLEYEQR